jgi:putative tricarboxylic transport membrane protein
LQRQTKAKTMTQQALNPWPQTLVGAGVLLIGLALAAGAVSIPGDAGYGGVGPNFLPWVVSVVLVLCGAMIVWEARTGGFREMDEPTGTQRRTGPRSSGCRPACWPTPRSSPRWASS